MSVQGRTITIRGSVECVEDLLIEGRVDGPIWNEHHVVVIGADAVVVGDIVARQITVRGAIEGTLMATGRVDVMDEARVAGRVLSQKFTLAEGAVFNGKAEPQHLDAALKVARHRRTEAAADATHRNQRRSQSRRLKSFSTSRRLSSASRRCTMTCSACPTTSRDSEVFREAMSARATSSVARTARKSSEAFPTASLNASSDISTVGALF